MLDSLLKSLGVLSTNGKLLFKSPLTPWGVLCITAAIIAAVLIFYRRTTAPISGRTRTLLITVKLLPLLLILVSLLEPVMVTSEVTPQQGFVLVLVDDSKSMRIQDAPGRLPRFEAVKRLMTDQELLASLSGRFKVRTFRFASDAERVEDLAGLEASGGSTNIAGALSQTTQEFRDLPLAGVVLVSDGADNASQGSNDLAGVAAALKAQGIPVYAVGVGQEHIEKDIEIVKVATSKTLAAGSVTDLFVTIRGHGFPGQAVDLHVKEGTRVVRTEKVELGKDGETKRVKLSLAPESPGIFEYTVQVPPRPSETITENNQRSFLVDNRSPTARVLYVDGYPRKEFKFIRRSVEEDRQIQLASLVRVSKENRLYRQGVRTQEELRDGYPRTKEELFQYDAVIVGDVEAGWFTPQQLQMTEEFVSVRGGGFLMLGGDHTFAEGGYVGTPIEDVLPVRIGGGRRGSGWGTGVVDREFRVGLTPDGKAHPMLRIAPDPDENLRHWGRLPELVGYNRVGEPKPGATVLAVDQSTDLLEGSNIILAVQRYGQGRSMVFMTAGSWRWQMLMPAVDPSHERIWQQIVRWLALSSPSQVTLTLDRESYGDREPVTIKARVVDTAYAPVNDASVWAQVTDPTGQSEAVELEWTFSDGGTYRAEYHPKAGGMHRVEVFVKSPETITARDQGGFSVAESASEYTDAVLHADVLTRLAETTGGQYVGIEQARRLPDAIKPVKRMTSMVIEKDLRDIPPLFAAVVLLLSLEWVLRRRQGLA